MRGILGSSLIAGALVCAGAAAAAPSVEINHAAARVTVIPEARSDIAVMVVKANSRLPLHITRVGEHVIVDGNLAWRPANCHTVMGRPGVGVMGLGSVGYDDLPQVVIRTPRVAHVSAGGAIYGSIGAGDGVDLGSSGCGDWTVADQSGLVSLRLAGSGDVRAASAAQADVNVSGSGDVRLGAVHNGLTAAVAGSGNVVASSVSGPLHARIAGSGDVRIHDGAVTDMDVAVSGSGDIRFGGVARNLDAHVAGSGDISVAQVTGAVSKHVAGSGEIHIGR